MLERITHDLSIASQLFIDPGEKIILPDKMWANYRLVFQHANLGTYPTFHEEGYNVGGLEKKLLENSGKQVVVLNFPHNPTGYSVTKKGTEEISRILKESAERGNRIVVLCDDAYFGLFYEDEVYPQSIFSKLADLHEKLLAVKLDGVTKEMYLWGLRVGFITYSWRGIDDEVGTALEDKTAGAVRGNISKVSMPSQYLVLHALESGKLKKEERKNREVLERRYKTVKNELEKEKYSKHFKSLPFNSGYFLCVRLKDCDGEEVRQKLLKDYDTGVIAMGDLLRIAFSSVPNDDLRQLFENIYGACEELS